MHLTSPPASARRLAIGLAAAGLLTLPTTALAAPEDEPSPTSADAAGCTDHLVTLRPDGAEGDEFAVGITAQTLDARLPGWAHATWQTAPGTRLSAVIATAPDGSTSRLPVSESGEASDVVALTFCGSALAGADPEPSGAEPQRTTSGDVNGTSAPDGPSTDGSESTSQRTAPSDTSGTRAPAEPRAAPGAAETPAGADPDEPEDPDEAVATLAAADGPGVAQRTEGSWWQRLSDGDRRAAPATVHDTPDTAPAEARPAGGEAIATTLIRSDVPTPAGGSADPIGVAWLLGGVAGATAWLPIRHRRHARRPTTTWG